MTDFAPKTEPNFQLGVLLREGKGRHRVSRQRKVRNVCLSSDCVNRTSAMPWRQGMQTPNHGGRPAVGNPVAQPQHCGRLERATRGVSPETMMRSDLRV